MDSIFLLAGGFGIAVGGYFLYLAYTKGLPAAVAWAKAKWNAAKNDLAQVRGDAVAAQAYAARLEQDLNSLTLRVEAIEAKAPKPVAMPMQSAAAPVV